MLMCAARSGGTPACCASSTPVAVHRRASRSELIVCCSHLMRNRNTWEVSVPESPHSLPHSNECDVDLPSRSHSVRIGAMRDDTARRPHRNVTETALKGHSSVAQTRSHEHRCPCPEAS